MGRPLLAPGRLHPRLHHRARRVCQLEPEFTKRGVKLIGLSANDVEHHHDWVKDINEISNTTLRFPVIGDKQRQVALAYDMLDHQDATNVDGKGIAFTIRSVFIIDPKKTIRLILSYPASTGRNAAEVLRVVDSLQTGDKHKITTPINWVPGTFPTHRRVILAGTCS